LFVQTNSALETIPMAPPPRLSLANSAAASASTFSMAASRSGATGACPMAENANASASVSASAERVSIDLFMGLLLQLWRSNSIECRCDGQYGYLHSARKIPSGFFVMTSQLDSTPTAATRSSVNTTPTPLTEGLSCQSIFISYLQNAHVSPMAAAEPIDPASSPNTPYSIRVM